MLYEVITIQDLYPLMAPLQNVQLLFSQCRITSYNVCYTKLLRKGFLTGKIDQHTTFDNNDLRSTVPRLSPENIKANLIFVDLVKQVAQRKNATLV